MNVRINGELINKVVSNPILNQVFFNKLKEIDDKDRERYDDESIRELKQKVAELKGQES